MPERSDVPDETVAQQEEAAAQEAGAIGGPDPDPGADPERQPVEEAGGGEAEGFEKAEEELERQASHDEPGRNPRNDAFSPEDAESEGTAEYGEADSASSPES